MAKTATAGLLSIANIPTGDLLGSTSFMRDLAATSGSTAKRFIRILIILSRSTSTWAPCPWWYRDHPPPTPTQGLDPHFVENLKWIWSHISFQLKVMMATLKFLRSFLRLRSPDNENNVSTVNFWQKIMKSCLHIMVTTQLRNSRWVTQRC